MKLRTYLKKILKDFDNPDEYASHLASQFKTNPDEQTLQGLVIDEDHNLYQKDFRHLLNVKSKKVILEDKIETVSIKEVTHALAKYMAGGVISEKLRERHKGIDINIIMKKQEHAMKDIEIKAVHYYQYINEAPTHLS